MENDQEPIGVWGAFNHFVNNLIPRGVDNDDKNEQISNLSKYEFNARSYEPSWRQLEGKPVVEGVVLSLWDNIGGPHIEQVWYNKKSSVPPEILVQSASFTRAEMMIDSELDDKTISKVEHKFLVLKDYFCSCLIFIAKYNGGDLTKFSLTFVFPKKMLPKYRYMHNIIRDRMLQLIEIYKKVANYEKENSKEAVSCIDSNLQKFLDNITVIASAQLQPLNLGSTLFSKEQDGKLKLFLAQVITSQLQTGCTLVVGPDENTVTEWLRTLALFLLPQQKHIASDTIISKNYIPDLALQGLVRQKEEIEEELIIESTAPTTLVDLHVFEVKQTHPYHEYLVIRRDYFDEQRRRYVKEEARTEANLWEAQEDLFRIPDSAPIIENIIDKVYQLPQNPPYLRQGWIGQQIVLLQRKTIILLKYVEALSEAHALQTQSKRDLEKFMDPTENNEAVIAIENMNKTSRRSSDSRNDRLTESRKFMNGEINNGGKDLPKQIQQGDTAMELRETKKLIRQVLGLSDACFFVLLGTAEKLKPGTYVYVAGNPAWIEEKLVQITLYENWFFQLP